MSSSADFEKDPDAVLDWNFDWSAWLIGAETISTSTFLVSAGIAKGDGSTVPPGGGTAPPAPSNTPTTTKVWLFGGTPGKPYLLTNRVVTSTGRTDDRSITIRVTNR